MREGERRGEKGRGNAPNFVSRFGGIEAPAPPAAAANTATLFCLTCITCILNY